MSDQQYNATKTGIIIGLIRAWWWVPFVLGFAAWLIMKGYLWFNTSEIIENHNAEVQAEADAENAAREQRATETLEEIRADRDAVDVDEIRSAIENMTDEQQINDLCRRFPRACD